MIKRLAPGQRGLIVAALGSSLTVSWASSYYIPAVLAVPMAESFGLSPVWVFGAFSMAMIVSAVVSPWAGARIDRIGGREVLMVSNLVFATGLVLLAVAPSFALFCVGWAVIGLGMGIGLYEAGFASLASIYGKGARGPITGITLIAGFASTVGWPLSGLMLATWGWREACVGWALIHLLVALPLNAWLPGGTGATAAAAPVVAPVTAPVTTPVTTPVTAPVGGTDPVAAPAASATVAAADPASTTRSPDRSAEAGNDPDSPPPSNLALGLLAFVFAATWFNTTAMATHLPGLLQEAGASAAVAIAAGALIGPAQVATRVLEFTLLRRIHPLMSARFAAAAHPLAAVALVGFGGPAAYAFALIHGAGNGIMTIAKGTLPLALFGPSGYGRRIGWLNAPARVVQAAAPLIFGAALTAWGLSAIWLTAGIGAAACAALWLVRRTG